MYRPYGNSVANSSSLLDVESIIRGLTQDYCTAFNTGNYDQVSALFASDGLFMPPNREPVQGPRAIEWLLRQYGEWGYQDLRLETVRVDYAADVAIEIGRYSIAIHQPDGTAIADRGKFVHGWRRLGAWLMLADSWNSNLPAHTKL
jgi:uncharacterized protein (TIGR02246 family)